MCERVIKLGFLDNGTGKHQSNIVISAKGLAPAITTIQGGGNTTNKNISEG